MVPDQQAPVRYGVRDQLAPRAPVKPQLAGTGGAVDRTGGHLTGGGTAGNERLTAATGIILILLLATIGVTIVRIGSLLWVHLFVGLVLIPVVLLKLGSTGYRFVRYYTSNPVYRERGAPPLALRLLGPIVVATSFAVLATGVVLLFVGPESAGVLRELHKLSFFLWVAFMAIHVLGHLPDLQKTFLTKRGERFEYNNLAAGRTGRTIALLGALVAGTVLAILLIPDFGAWTTHFGAFHHH
ncbi:MAG TPA: hypothetical protein VIJ33_04785 [Solirubrobacteraceae bacterium]